MNWVLNIVKKLIFKIILKTFYFKYLDFFCELSKERNKILYHSIIYTNFENVEGDYLEFGVASGRSFIKAYDIIKKNSFKLKDKTRLFAFDSFEGFPKLTEQDKIIERFKEGEEKFEIKIFENNLKKHNVDEKLIIKVPGWFEKTLNDDLKKKYQITKARVINFDCDLYSSTILALVFCKSLLQPGTVLLFDDWYCYKSSKKLGEQSAFYEFLEKNKNIKVTEYKNYANAGKSFIVTSL